MPMEKAPVIHVSLVTSDTGNDVDGYPGRPGTYALDLDDIDGQGAGMQYRAKSEEDARQCAEKIRAALIEHTDITPPLIVCGAIELEHEGSFDDEEA